MKRKNINILTIILSIVLVVAIIFGIYWAVNNVGKVKETMNGTNLYTYDDVQNAYSDGYNTALDNKSEYDELIATYRDTITTLNNNINTLNTQIATLQSTITTKNGNITDLQSQITTLQTQKTNLESQIETLNGLIASLQSEIENQYEYEYTLDITYIVDGQPYAYGKARENGTVLVQPTAPIKNGYNFIGWSLTENGTIVDLTTTTLNQNTTLYAVFEFGVQTISFTINGTTYQAESGMIWGDWVNSEYNTGSFGITQEYTINHRNRAIYVYYNDTIVVVTDTIISNGIYTLAGGGGGD